MTGAAAPQGGVRDRDRLRRLVIILAGYAARRVGLVRRRQGPCWVNIVIYLALRRWSS